MAALTGNSVATSYQGLLKTADNAAINATLKNMTDGTGNATPLSMANNYVQLQAPTIELIESTGGTNLMMISPTNVYFEGAVDFTNASVTGISAGLVTGGQLNTLKSSASLTTNPATTLNANDIAIGENAIVQLTAATNLYSLGGAMAIGQNAKVIKNTDYSFGDDQGGIAIGINAQARMGLPSGGGGGISIGQDSFSQAGAIAIGYSTNSVDGSLSLGWNANATGGTAISIGKNNNVTGSWGISIGEGSSVTAGGFRTGGISMGAAAAARATNCITIGNGAIVDDAVRVDTVVIGNGAKSAQYSTAVGSASFAIGDYCSVVGQGSRAAGSRASVLGTNSFADFNDTTSIGSNTTALNWANSVTMKQLALIATGNYADDTAAATAGVPINGVYHNAGALRIRIV